MESNEGRKLMNKIIKATCLSCGQITTNQDQIMIMNDLDNICDCGERFVRWDMEKGFVITAEIQDYEGNTHYFREELN